MKSRKRLWPILTISWAAIILFVSVIPGEDLPSLSIWEPDKVMHATVYGLLAFFTWRSTQIISAEQGIRIIFIAGGLCILFGFIIELIQLLLPSRSFDMLDVLANSIGCAISLLICGAVGLSKKRKWKGN